MNLRDATLVLAGECADQPAVAALAWSVCQRLTRGEEVGYQQLEQLTGEISGAGVLRALHARYSPVAFAAIVGPILREIDRQKPVPARERPDPADDPLRAAAWPPG